HSTCGICDGSPIPTLIIKGTDRSSDKRHRTRDGRRTLKLLGAKGTPLDKQQFTWKQLVQEPISKLDDDAFTRVRVILMNGVAQESNRFLHSFARMNKEFQLPLAQVRRVTQHQQTLVNWLISADHSPLEV